MASKRELDLIIKVVNLASAELRKIRSDLQDVSNIGIGQKVGSEISEIGSAASIAGGGVAGIAFGFNQIVTAAQTALTAAKPFFDATIGAVERFNEKVLSSQTNLASAVDIFQGGKRVDDATQKITATRDFIESLVKQVEIATRDLTGVTSESVIGVTDVLVRNSGLIVGQFDKTKRDLKGTLTELTKGFASELKLSGLDLAQANQEIGSILRGDLNADSLIGKKLGLTNPDIAKYKSQGRLIEEVLTRLQVSVSGNAILSSQSLSGQFSNILESFQLISREVAKPIFQPIVNAVKAVSDAIAANQDTIIKYAKVLAEALANAFNGAVEGVKAFLQVLGDIKSGFEAFANTDIGKALIEGFNDTVKRLTDLVVELNKTITEGAGQAFKTFADSVNSSSQSLEDFNKSVNDAFSGIKPLLDVLGAVGGFVKEGVFDLLANQVTSVVELFKALAAIGGQAINGLISSIKPAIDLIGTGLKTITGSIDGFSKAIREKIVGTVEGLVSNPAFRTLAKVLGFDDKAIQDGLNKLKGNLSDAGQKLQDTAQQGKKAAEELGKGAKSSGDDFDIQGKKADQLGSSYKQLRDRIEGNRRAIKEGLEGPELTKSFETQVKDLQDAAEKGFISPEVAQKELEAISNNAQATVEVQQSAIKGITALKKQELDKQVQDIDAQIADVEASVGKGERTQVQAAERVTELKKQQLQLQIKDVEQSIADEQEAIGQGRGSATRLAQLQTQQKKLNAQLEKESVEGEKRIQEAKIKEIDRAAARLASATKIAESGRLKTIQDLLNQGQITEEEANARKLRSTQTTLQEEFKAAQDNLKKLEALPRLSDPEGEEARQAKIRDARQKTSDLSLRLAENERAVQIAIVDVIKKKIDEQSLRFKNSIEAQNQALQQQLQLQEALTRSLDAQGKLLSAREELQKSLSDLTQSQYSNSIRLLEAQFDAEDKLKGQVKDRAELEKKVREAKNPDDRKAAEEELKDFDKRLKREEQLRNLRIEAKQAEIAAAQQEFALQRQSLQLEVLKNKALQEQERIRLNIEASQARAETAQRVADLAKVTEDAKLGKATQGQVEAARLQVGASQQKEQGIALQQVNQQQLAGVNALVDQQKQQVLSAQQSSKLQGLQTDLAILTGGNATQQQIQSASKSLASGNQAPDALRRQVEQILPQVLGAIPGLQQSFLGQARATGRATLDNGLDQQLQTAQQQLARTPIVVPPQEQLIPQSIQKGADGMKLFTDAITKLNTKLDTLGNQITIPTTIEGVSDPRTAATLAVNGITKALQTATGKR